jgi:hypothetical protein
MAGIKRESSVRRELMDGIDVGIYKLVNHSWVCVPRLSFGIDLVNRIVVAIGKDEPCAEGILRVSSTANINSYFRGNGSPLIFSQFLIKVQKPTSQNKEQRHVSDYQSQHPLIVDPATNSEVSEANTPYQDQTGANVDRGIKHGCPPSWFLVFFALAGGFCLGASYHRILELVLGYE